jgi:BirA family biotin operon repressor/biotin-[acetyl-CoA-carboxylase] ligase
MKEAPLALAPFHLIRLARVGSTQDEARARAARGAASGTVILADEQTAGRGRRERTWDSAAGRGIWMTLVHRSTRPMGEWPALTLCGCLGVCRALESIGLDPAAKWPNDVWVGGRKIAGVLADTEEGTVLLGIGVNVLQAPEEFPEEIRASATSLRIESKEGTLGPEAIDREEVLRRVLRALAEALGRFESDGPAPIVTSIWERSLVRSRQVTVELPTGERVCGPAIGLGPVGELCLAARPSPLTISSGTVVDVEGV